MEPHLDAFLKVRCGMKSSDSDSCLYTRYKKGKLDLVIMIYVDDILLMSKKCGTLTRAKFVLGKRFEMKDLGTIK